MTTKLTPYDRGYLDGLKNHTDYFRPGALVPSKLAEYIRGYTEAQERAHEAGLPERRRLASLNLPRVRRAI